MIEKVNPAHPDKIADRIAGAIVDLAYAKDKNGTIAVEVLIGHGNCYTIIETSVAFEEEDVNKIIKRIGGDVKPILTITKQDINLRKNQEDKIRCGDNGIFKGMPLTEEQKELSKIVRDMYEYKPFDGKYILDNDHLIISQSNITTEELKQKYPNATINQLGYWTGGINVDSGATNRKLGSDMADSITGGGLHGKDLSKADVSVNIYAFMKAQETGQEVKFVCAIGDEFVNGIPYEDIVEFAREYIENIGGFEKFAEWGLF